MKLNIDCVRDVMIYLENNLELVDYVSGEEIELEYSKDDILYSCSKLIEAGYIDGRSVSDLSGNLNIDITGITWNGHQFLDNVRSNKIWKKTKETTLKIGSASISFLSNISAQIIANVISGKIQI